jgi:hypothetical protein
MSQKRARSTTNETGVITFVCDFDSCTFEANSSSSLKRHKVSHSAPLLYCDFSCRRSVHDQLRMRLEWWHLFAISIAAHLKPSVRAALKGTKSVIALHYCTAISRDVRLKQLTHRTSSDTSWIIPELRFSGLFVWNSSRIEPQAT